MNPIKIKLTKLSDNKNALRTQEVEGVCYALPEPGKWFLMYGKPLERHLEDGVRYLRTSPVKEYDAETGVFATENSLYKLETL